VSWTHKSPGSGRATYQGRNRFEHWARDNQVCLVAARCRDRFPAFASEEAKRVFWDRFDHCTTQYGFVPWVTSLLDNHYHTVGYLREAAGLGTMMQRLHGSVAKLVNGLLPERRRPFWRDAQGHDYFDGCLRDETQCVRSHRYVLRQAVRHGICDDFRDYPHTRVDIELERGLRRATQLNAFLRNVRYKRYDT